MSDRNDSPLIRLLRYAKPHRPRLLAATACSILNKIFDLAPPALIGAAVDIVVTKEKSFFARMGIVDVGDQLVALAVLTVLVWAAESLFEYIFKILWRNLAQTLQHELRLDAYAHIQRLDMGYFHSQSTGGLMSILNDDVNQLERFLDDGANSIIQVITTAIIISIAFFVLAPGVAWMAMLPVPFILIGSFRFQRLLTERYADVRQRVGDLNGQLSNNLTGVATIKSFTTEEYEVERIRVTSDAYRSSNSEAIRLSSAFSPLIRMIIVAGFTATLVWGGHLTLDGKLAVGTYSVLIFLTQRLLWPLTRLGQTFDLYQRAMASSRRVLDLLAIEASVSSGDTPLPLDSVSGAVSFDAIDFAYDPRVPILERFDLDIPAGATVGVVGATGSGKTTLINLMLRFYEPQAGSISIDGQDVRELDLRDLRRAVGLVSQSVYLFHGTVAQNIAYGSFDASRADIERAALAAEAHDFINALPDGYDTVVGERGQTLSGGQRQRLSIARALLKNPPILILDEATSAVDNETEAALQRSLDRLSAERTTIVIAHRLSTVRHADEILVLDAGAIAERGRHEDLVDSAGPYARLWNIQTGQRTEPRDGAQTD